MEEKGEKLPRVESREEETEKKMTTRLSNGSIYLPTERTYYTMLDV